MKKTLAVALISAALLCLSACGKSEELDESEIDARITSAGSEFDEKTTWKPWNNEEFKAGTVGGTWNSTILSDPKTFNQLIGQRDGESAGIISMTLDYLVDYNVVTRKWEPRAAFFEIETDEEKGTLTVHYTIRDDLYWTWYGSDEKVPVTSEDILFWYNVIDGQPEFESSGYGSQYVEMPDGTEAEIKCVKISDKKFDFIYPRIVANPLLSTNMEFCPSFIYKKAYEEGGVEAVKALFSIDIDPKTLPSMGKWYLTEYTPGQRLVYKRNPNFWKKDSNGVSLPYYEEEIVSIVGDQNTDYLLFKQGKQETYSPRPEDVSDLVNNQKDDYTVFRAAGSMSAPLWSFNQNPATKDKASYNWFTKKEFRQAMSCLLNRDRIISQAYRGLADPKYDFFPAANPMYDPEIQLEYKFSLEKAESLLKSVGFTKKDDGFLYDDKDVKVEYDLQIPSNNTVFNDIALIISDECKKVGITVNVRQIDFQKLVEMLTRTYDWESIMIGLGSNLFPTQGSNVWPSYGNLHLWYPLQESPATDWEARIDWLYNEGSYTADDAKAKVLWDEYQKILLEQCPVIYLMRNRSFFAIQNRWDFTNVYYDNLNGAELQYVYLKK
ncbi:MAG: ABC transporter substrate-binding protein [Treponema sp.]|nr:ABC transporter substrate-binding protein [Treponema sp.]